MGTYNVELTLLFLELTTEFTILKKMNQDLNLEEPKFPGCNQKVDSS